MLAGNNNVIVELDISAIYDDVIITVYCVNAHCYNYTIVHWTLDFGL